MPVCWFPFSFPPPRITKVKQLGAADFPNEARIREAAAVGEDAENSGEAPLSALGKGTVTPEAENKGGPNVHLSTGGQ